MDILKLIRQHPEIEVRLAWSKPYQLAPWELAQMLRENWRWN